MTTKSVRVIKYEGAGAFTPTPDIWGRQVTRRHLSTFLVGSLPAGPLGGGSATPLGRRPGSTHGAGGPLHGRGDVAIDALTVQHPTPRSEELAVVADGPSLPVLRTCQGDRVVVVLVVHVDPDEDPGMVPVAVPVPVPVV